MAEITLRVRAENDVLRIYAECEFHAAGRGEGFSREVEKTLALLSRMPRLGRFVGAPYRRMKLSRNYSKGEPRRDTNEHEFQKQVMTRDRSPFSEEQSIVSTPAGSSIRADSCPFVVPSSARHGLAGLADLNPRTVQKIEACDITILVTALQGLRAALGCEWRRLLGA